MNNYERTFRKTPRSVDAAHNNDCIPNPRNLDLSTDDWIPVVDKKISQPVPPNIQNNVEKNRMAINHTVLVTATIQL